MTEFVRVFDTTLRDGEQAPGCSMRPPEKLRVARQLAALNVDIIEAGFAASSPGESDAVTAIAREIGHAGGPTICSLARATADDIAAAGKALRPAARSRIHVFLATSDIHIEHKLRCTRAEVLERAATSVSLARQVCDEVEFSAEDAARSDVEFLCEVVRVAVESGATTINIPDTVGYALPWEYEQLIRRVIAVVGPNVIVSAHCHDDLGMAVANTISAVRAGARQVEGTINGIGERAGNAAIEEIVMALRTRSSVFALDTRVVTTEIARTSALVAECTGIQPPPNKAIVGDNAFSHEAGIHQDGMLKHRLTYEVVNAESVGRTSSLVLGKHSGRGALRQRMNEMGVSVDDAQLQRVSTQMKELADGRQGGRVEDAEILAMANGGADGGRESGRNDGRNDGRNGDTAPAAAKKVVAAARSSDRSYDRRSDRSSDRPSDRSSAVSPTSAKTLFEKVWDSHIVVPESSSMPAVLYIDLHLVHEVTSPQAFAELRSRKLKVRQPGRTVATMDHSTPTSKSLPMLADAQAQLHTLEQNCKDFGVPLYALGDDRQGIVHVIGPELGLTRPGSTIVCGDSHTSTHGAFGALAFGIGTSQVAHVLATQCLLQTRPKTLRVNVTGSLGPCVTAKDVILALIAQIGTAGATEHVIEYAGPVIERLSMEERMTICNMSIEAGARAGMIAPDETTFEFLSRTGASKDGWDDAVRHWRTLRSDAGATFDAEVTLDANRIEPMITYGTNPGMGIGVTASVPDPDAIRDDGERARVRKALDYMKLAPGQPLAGTKVDVVFVGSCTNSRLRDLRQVADVLRGRKVASGVRMLVVPGSQQVKRDAEREGIADVIRAAGAEWREAGCSMCIAMNGDRLEPGQLAVSTSNRNFEGRQGRGGRTLLASPLTAAAAAVTGRITDPRTL